MHARRSGPRCDGTSLLRSVSGQLVVADRDDLELFGAARRAHRDDVADAVVVGRGPGSFTGVRIGVAFYIWIGVFNMVAVAQFWAFAKFLGERNIDILNSSSLSMISNICMVWRMMADLSYYGDSAGLKEEFDILKRQRAVSLSKVDSIEIEASNISERYTKGVAAPGSDVKVRSIKQYRKTNTVIKNGTFQVPEDYLRAIDNLVEGQPVMMVADQDSMILSVTPLDPKSRLAELDFIVPDKPGAIYEITKVLADQDINLLSVRTKVLVYYETMSMSIVADVSQCDKDLEVLRAKTEAHLANLKGK